MLAPKSIVSTVPEKDLVVALLCFDKFTNFSVVQCYLLWKTKHHKVRMQEHLRILALTDKIVKGDDVVKEQLLIWNYLPDFKDGELP